MDDTFNRIYKNNEWKSDESVSGRGSTLKETEEIRRQLPILFTKLGIRTLLDIPCGDFHWFSSMVNDLGFSKYNEGMDFYIGADIVPELITKNRLEHLITFLDFRVLDVTKDELPKVDLILCRDMLGHFSNWEVKLALDNFKRSGAKWLLATTFPGRQTTGNIRTGEWRPIDLDHWWGLPKPTLMINENCTEGDGKFADKSLGLWRIDGKST